jgi:hypothetical protein
MPGEFKAGRQLRRQQRQNRCVGGWRVNGTAQHETKRAMHHSVTIGGRASSRAVMSGARPGSKADERSVLLGLMRRDPGNRAEQIEQNDEEAQPDRIAAARRGTEKPARAQRALGCYRPMDAAIHIDPLAALFTVRRPSHRVKCFLDQAHVIKRRMRTAETASRRDGRIKRHGVNWDVATSAGAIPCPRPAMP